MRVLRFSPLLKNQHFQMPIRPSITSKSLFIYLFMAVLNDLNQPGHSIADKELIPLELQLTLKMSRRKAREGCLIDKGKTLSPDGLNRRD